MKKGYSLAAPHIAGTRTVDYLLTLHFPILAILPSSSYTIFFTQLLCDLKQIN